MREVFDGLVNQPVAADFAERVARATALPPDLRDSLLSRYG